MSYSAGLLNVGSITLTDSAGTAASLNATTATVGTLNVNGNANVSTLDYTNLHAGNLDVSGTLTASGFSLDASGVGYFSNQLKIQQPWLQGAKTSVNQNFALLNEQAQLSEDITRSTLMQFQREKTLTHIAEEGYAFDYIVVGSGSGGGIAALTLALEGPKTGKQVLLIEKGQRRNPNIYHEYPSATSSTYYYGKHYIEDVCPVDYNVPSIEVYLSEPDYYPWWTFNGDNGKTANFSRGLASPNILGGGSSVNGGIVNAAPLWGIKKYMPNVNPDTFSLCCNWVMDRIATGHNFGGGKYNKTLNHIADFWNYAFNAPQMYLAYEKDPVTGNYTDNALQLQSDYQIFPLPGQSVIPENYRGFAVPETGGFRMKMSLTCDLGLNYVKRRGVAYLLEIYQGKNLSILTEVRGDRIVFQDLSGGQTVPEYDMSANFLSGTQRVATGLVCTDISVRSGTTIYPKEFTVNLKKGGEILLAGNVYHSPLLALRSGIGGLDASGWGARGITQTVKNPLVGKNYRNTILNAVFPRIIMNYNKIPDYDPLTDKVNFFSDDLQQFPNNQTMEYVGYFRDTSYNTVGDHGPDGLFNYHPEPIEYTAFMQMIGASSVRPQIQFDTNSLSNSVYYFCLVPGLTQAERQTNFELAMAISLESYISDYYNQSKGPYFLSDGVITACTNGISNFNTSIESSNLGGVDGGTVSFKDVDASGNYDLYTPKVDMGWFREYSDILKVKAGWRKWISVLTSPAMRDKDSSGNYLHLPQALRKGELTPEELDAKNNFGTFTAVQNGDILINRTWIPRCDDIGEIIWYPGGSLAWDEYRDYGYIDGSFLADTPNVYYYTGNDTSNNKVADPSRNPINRKIGPSNFTNLVIFDTTEGIHWTGSMSKAVDSAFRVLGTSNVRVADSSVIKFPAICNTQGYCMGMGRYVALTTIGSVLAQEPEPMLVNPTDILPRHFDSDYIKNNFIITGGGFVQDSVNYKVNYTNAFIDVSGIKYGGFTYDYSGNITKHSYTWNYPSNMDGHHLDSSGYVTTGDLYTCPWNVYTDVSGNNYFEWYTTLPDQTHFDENAFLCTSNNSYSNFIVSYEIQQFKDPSSNTIADVGTNSGMNFRARITPSNAYTPSICAGWQVESSNIPSTPVEYSQSGAYWDEGGVRQFKGLPAVPIAGTVNKFNDWNKFTLQVTTDGDGIPTYKTWLNGTLVAQFTDVQAHVWYPDNINHTVGCFGFQAHFGVPGILTQEKSRYRIRNWKIQTL
jgi:choline dehydrogenase-like flavoprotein